MALIVEVFRLKQLERDVLQLSQRNKEAILI